VWWAGVRALVVGVALLGCRRAVPALPIWTGADGGPAPALPARSPGCEQAGQAPSGALERSVKVAGYDRRYLMVVPQGHTSAPPLPVVFFFNGRTSMDRPPPAGKVLAGGLTSLALSREAIVVIPQGTPFPRERVIGWYVGCPSDDVDFFDAMLGQIERSHCIDPRAVFVAGLSWGAEMALALGCCRGEKIRAIAAASGSNVAATPRCPARRLPALRATYAAGGDGAYTKAEFAAPVDFFRQVHGCSAESDPIDPAPCVSYRGCAEPVIDCAYRGLGHAFPPDFAAATWGFFSKLAVAR
jgi:polyhydroxybutyrate depolymerase